MDLVISQSFGKIGVNKTDAFINIQQQKPDMDIKTSLSRVQIDTQMVQVQIDQTRCFNELGLKTIDAFTRNMAKKAVVHGLRAISEMAREGDFLARIEQNKNAIPVLAAQKMEKYRDYTLVTMPRSRPKIRFTGKTDISWEMGIVEIQVKSELPRISATRGSIDVYLIQKAYVEVEYRGRKVDKSL